ncbi:MAG: response regulator [Acidobacteria bacterium]|nr:response regulator [Acidobacteriota bacterium]
MTKTRARILVVDDDRNLLESYKLVLAVTGYDYSLAKNSAEAFDCLARDPHEAALVDLRIRDENGIELVGQLRAQYPLLECIVITAYPSHETAVQALKLGACDYLSKTAEPETILETIEDALNQRELKLAEQGSAKMEASQGISLSVVCDNTLLKKGLAEMIKGSPRLFVTHFYHNIALYLKKHPSPPSNITLMCGTCNFMDYKAGLENLEKIRLTFPETRIVIFNHKMSSECQVELLKLGVSGFLDTDLPVKKAEELLCLIYKGEIVAPSSSMMTALRELADNFGHQKAKDLAPAVQKKIYLTDREKEIVRCIARGLKNKEIGDQLFISEKTVKTHINNVFRKLEVENRLQAVNKVYEMNLLI